MSTVIPEIAAFHARQARRHAAAERGEARAKSAAALYKTARLVDQAKSPGDRARCERLCDEMMIAHARNFGESLRWR